MKKLKKEDISQEVFDLYDDYAHNRIQRKQFLEMLSVYAIGGITASSLLGSIMPDYKSSVQVAKDDPRLKSEFITYNSPKGGGKIRGLLSRPADAKGKLPGVVVVHENRGLNPYIEDVGRRLALEGFLTLAPDALTPLGGYPGNDDDGRALQTKRNNNDMLEDFISAYEYLISSGDCSGKAGVVGFCFGGWIANMMAVRLPSLSAAVPFYGMQPQKDDVARIKAPLMLHYAGLDSRVNEGWPAYEEALKQNGVNHTVFFYEGVNHGFHNNSTPRFDKAAADLAWKRTVEFFRKYLL